jgi:hypothetical protein
MWLIWEKFALNAAAGGVLSFLAALFSILACAIFGEYFFRLLNHTCKKD